MMFKRGRLENRIVSEYGDLAVNTESDTARARRASRLRCCVNVETKARSLTFQRDSGMGKERTETPMPQRPWAPISLVHGSGLPSLNA